MTCHYPLKAYQLFSSEAEYAAGESSKIVFNKQAIGKNEYKPIQLPCSQCNGCRLERSKQWAIRCIHESQDWNGDSCFITLTFDDKHLNKYGTLQKAEFQKFMKRLRKSSQGLNKDVITGQKPIRFFHCGEYGALLQRPHFHAILFNFDFEDKYLWDKRGKVRLYRSPKLEKLWPYGFSSIGDVTFESCAYVARYIMKKRNGHHAKYHYRRVNFETGEFWKVAPEYITMSRFPGIGKRWIEKNIDDVYPKDFFTNEGFKFKPPRYYDAVYEIKEPEKFLEIKEKRLLTMMDRADDNTPERLKVKAESLRLRMKKLTRKYEDGITAV